MNLLDKLVSVFSPEAGVRRLRARAALNVADRLSSGQRAYEGAKTGRRTAGWIAGATSADAEISVSAAKLRERSRALCRDNPYAARSRDIFCANVVGTGILAKAGSAQPAWDRWINECDADGLHDFYGLQALVMRAVYESGECLIRFRIRRPEDGLLVPLQLQVLEPDYLDHGKTGSVNGGGWLINGIEYNAIGQRVAYWLFSQHPGDNALHGSAGIQSKRVPADEVLHIFERQRPGQSRGAPRLAPVLLKMRDLDDYEEAELVRKGIESCFAAIVTSEDVGASLTDSSTDTAGNRIETLGAGLIQYLRPGQDVKFGAPAPGGDYGNYTKTQLRAIAAGIGLTYEQLTGDLSDVNYSSIRAGLVEFYRFVDMLQWHCLVPMMLQPIWKRWADTAYGIKAIKQRAEAYPTWTPPRRQWVDPLKDVNAARQEIAAGITSLSEVIRTRGEDPERVFAEIAAERDRLKALGIVTDLVAEPLPPEPTPPAKAKRNDADEWAGYDEKIGRVRQELTASLRARLEASHDELKKDIAAVRTQLPEIVIHNHNEIQPTPVEVKNQVNLPEQPAPVVNVAAPEVRVENTLPEQPPPIINVAAPEVRIENTVQPAEIILPARTTETTILRDGQGNIVKATQTETTAKEST